MIAVTPTQDDILAALKAFLEGVLPPGTPVIAGQANKVPEPAADNFVVMTPMGRTRIETNVEGLADAVFEGSITGAMLSVTSVGFGAINIGATIFGPGVDPTTKVTAKGTGTGGVGTYSIDPVQDVAQGTLAAGATSVLQPVEIMVQCDVYGPLAGDNAQIITTLFRSNYGVEAFQAIAPEVTPLYADDPKQVPFVSGEEQYQDRWIVEAMLQANQSVIIPQQYAGTAEIVLVELP